MLTRILPAGVSVIHLLFSFLLFMNNLRTYETGHIGSDFTLHRPSADKTFSRFRYEVTVMKLPVILGFTYYIEVKAK